MNPSLQVAIVNYLNTKPFIYGLSQSAYGKEFERHEIMPSLCAQWYLQGKADIALVPVGALGSFPDEMINEFGIASDGPVASVCLLSEVPVQQVKKLILDYQSSTSVTLARILLDQFWKLKPSFLEGFTGFETRIQGETAGLVIGDRAILLKSKFQYVYDLGEEWKNFTGLPFVFAVWLKNGIIPAAKVQNFNEALNYGLENIDKLLPEIQGYDPAFLKYYFNRNIKYHLQPGYMDGMQLFYEKRKLMESRPLALNLQ